MRMSRDYFSILGLTPGRYEPAEIARRFRARRQRLVAALGDPAQHGATRQQLDELYQAYNYLRDPTRQAEYVRAAGADAKQEDRVATLCRLVEASLEGGLLRYSRRAAIIAEGRRLGFSDFQTQLLIAQIQFADEILTPPRARNDGSSSPTHAQVAARFAAAGLLALAIFLAVVRWLGT
jgi:hypothetical protein